MSDIRSHVYNPFSLVITSFIVLILVLLFAFFFFGFVGTAFEILGFSIQDIVLLLLATFIGSFINIPLFTLTSDEPVVTDTYVTVFGVKYRVPPAVEGSRKTVVSVNVGGALIPVAVSLYLLWRFPETIGFAILGVTLVAIVSHFIARPVKGVGIVSPGLVAPAASAIFALVISAQVSSVNVFTLAYVSGVLGTLIGADLTNLKAIKGLGAPVASIGGAGTFDGVFLSGVVAILIAVLLA